MWMAGRGLAVGGEGAEMQEAQTTVYHIAPQNCPSIMHYFMQMRTSVSSHRDNWCQTRKGFSLEHSSSVIEIEQFPRLFSCSLQGF